MDDALDGDDSIDVNLRPLEAIARRLIVLTALCRRSFLETGLEREVLEEDPESERFDLAAWLKDQGLFGELTPEEDRLMNSPVGETGPGVADAATWNAEAVVALGWYVGLVPDISNI